MPANAVICWVYYPKGGHWAWRNVATYGDETAARAYLAAYLARHRRKTWTQGIDGVVLPSGVPPVGKVEAR